MITMELIDDQKLFDLYNDTLQKCGTYLLQEDEETIEYNIYEEFDIGIHTFFYSDNLKRLYRRGFISLNKFNASFLLREKFIQLQDSTEWTIENFKISKKWEEIMELSDMLKFIK